MATASYPIHTQCEHDVRERFLTDRGKRSPPSGGPVTDGRAREAIIFLAKTENTSRKTLDSECLRAGRNAFINTTRHRELSSVSAYRAASACHESSAAPKNTYNGSEKRSSGNLLSASTERKKKTCYNGASQKNISSRTEKRFVTGPIFAACNTKSVVCYTES